MSGAGERPRTAIGTFAPSRAPWTPGQWDEGYFDNRGRFRVYRPDCPRSFGDGYALRAHVVWWLRTGSCHADGMNLHHLNENKADDRFENLAVIEHGQHVRLHRKKEPIPKRCPSCGEVFLAPRKKPKKKYCSAACYHRHPKSVESRRKQSEALKKAYAEGRR